MVAIALVPGDETDLAAGEHVLKDGLSANFIVHTQKNGDAMTAFEAGMFEQLQKHRKEKQYFFLGPSFCLTHYQDFSFLEYTWLLCLSVLKKEM